MSDVRTVSEDEGRNWVLTLLADGAKRDTREIEEESHKQNMACPDSTARFLSRMRSDGLILGELSIPRKTWLWWRSRE